MLVSGNSPSSTTAFVRAEEKNSILRWTRRRESERDNYGRRAAEPLGQLELSEFAPPSRAGTQAARVLWAALCESAPASTSAAAAAARNWLTKSVFKECLQELQAHAGRCQVLPVCRRTGGGEQVVPRLLAL